MTDGRVTFEASWLVPSSGGGPIVPKRYLRSSGLAASRFHVRRVGHVRFLRHPGGGAIEIRPSALCILAAREREFAVLVDDRAVPRLSEALLLIASLGAGEHRNRYLTLYRAYECLQPHPDGDLAAVRHGLSHPSSRLSRPSTLAALRALFGGTVIDTSSSRHLRTLYRQFGRLALEVDALVREEVLRSLPSLRVLESSRQVLRLFEVYGQPGVVEPIPVRGVEGME
jgi:hypothetical protein